MNIRAELEYQQDIKIVSEFWTLDAIKTTQRRVLFECLEHYPSVLLLLDGIVDDVVERTYGDLINQQEYFQPFCGPKGLVFRNKEKIALCGMTDTIPMAFNVNIEKVNPAWVDELVDRLRVIAIGNMVQNRIFSIYVPFHVSIIGDIVIVKTRYGVLKP